jgi:hypothetical protein
MANGETTVTTAQRATMRAAAEHEALLAAMHRLEKALATAASGRERAWARHVAAALRGVRHDLEEHRRSSEDPDGILAELQNAMPEAAYRINQLRQAHRAFLDEVDGLCASVERFAATGDGSVDAVRRRVAALLSELHHHQARQIDLIFEAFQRDIGAVD